VYGLAGLRVGYGLCGDERFREAVDQVRQPFHLNAVAQAAAAEALRHQDAVEDRVARTIANRLALEEGIRGLGLWLADSEANFVWVRLAESEDAAGDEAAVARGLAERGVLVRAGASLGRDGALRVTVGTEAENAKFVAALSELV
jgi:histidinol-phosphate aminotransferase